MPETNPSAYPPCPKCGGDRTARIKRQGLLQSLILFRFGFYPWECSGCRRIFLAKNRGKLKRRRRANGEARLPPIA